ncbi:MAG: precorrin-8X methylmutase [Geminicoccaceae bacterium]
MADYLRDPQAIYARSFALIRAEVALDRFPPSLHGMVLRLVHACGMADIAAELAWHGDAAGAARAALRAGAPVIVDARMVAAGIMADRVPTEVLLTLDDPRTRELATAQATTRSAAAVELWRPRLHGAVVAIGNAPTALFHLLDRLREWPERPAAILAFPVGFVGAAESKQALIDSGLDVPWLTLRGRRGGSALAAAAVNALLVETP